MSLEENLDEDRAPIHCPARQGREKKKIKKKVKNQGPFFGSSAQGYILVYFILFDFIVRRRKSASSAMRMRGVQTPSPGQLVS